ncbi:hypothetical protein F5Y10DRAFT_236622 [Nemania abortiva]|nr:hypothetical protein F5Y10DRAFT_236622 [Nemania abortiva]
MAPTGGTGASAGGGRGRAVQPVAFDGRQVAASNSTLNAWVGRRQPAWLANATPVQPSPRPARPPPPPTPSPKIVTATPHVEIAASSQPQPQHQPQSQSQSQSHAQSQSRPHPPTQQQQQQQSQSRIPQQSQPQSQHNLQPQSQLLDQSSHQPAQTSPPAPGQPPTTLGPPHLSTSSADPVLPSPAPSDEPSPCLSLLRDSPKNRNPCPVSSHTDPPTTEAHFVLDNHVNYNPLSSPPSRDPASPDNNGQSASPQGVIQTHPLLAVSSAGEMALNTPPTPTVTGSSNASAVPPEAPRSIAPKRRGVENNYIAFLESLGALLKLDAYLREMGGEQSLEESIERPRFLLLLKACREGDLFFVAFHQLFCSWTKHQSLVHGLCESYGYDTSLVDSAFGTMGTVLKPNSRIGKKLLPWFANFPVQLTTLQLHECYRQAIHQVLDFLICVSKKWVLVNHDHSVLGYPLLMNELINTFHLYSPILQSIVFRASRRTLGASDHPIGIKLDELFRSDQEKHVNPNDGTYSQQYKGDTYDEYNNKIIQRYRLLIAQHPPGPQTHPSHISSLPSTSSAAQSPSASSPSTVSDHLRLQPEVAHGFRPVPTPISTGRAVPNSPSIHTPSPTYSPVTSLHTGMNPNTSAAFTQFAAVPPQVTSNSPIAGMTTSPYQSPNLAQQGQYGAFNPYTQQQLQHHLQQQQKQQLEWHQAQQQQMQRAFQQQQQQEIQQQQLVLQQMQQMQAEQLRQRQVQPRQFQQQPQQQQQLQHVTRKRSQPGVAPNLWPSPTQATLPLPSQVLAAGQPSPHFQNTNIRAAPPRNVASFAGSQNLVHQASAVDSVMSPRMANAVQPSNVRPRPLVGPQRQPSQTSGRLIPPPGLRISLQDYPYTPYEKRSVDSSLHQAHLRSPKRIRVSSAASYERYYQAVKDFILEPTPILQTYLNEFTFDIADTVLEKLTLNERVAGEALLVNRFSDGSLRIRLRCCNRPKTTSAILDHVWVSWETSWPDHIFMNFNDQVIEIKRKPHHSRDLPVDISSFIRSGANHLRISILPPSTQLKPHTPYIAVEIVEVLSHSAILQMVRASGSKPAAETREVIRKRLAGTGDDDDLEIPSDGISVDLADPFTATIFTTPVRGKACTHLECFDLENWLNTRLGKKSACICGGGSNCRCPKEPSFVDKWKCPFCDGDARPYSLRIDEFLAEIRTRLEQNNQLRTKSITVFADGSWKANDLPDDDDSDIDSDDNGTRATSKTISKPSVPRNVIELDDD